MHEEYIKQWKPIEAKAPIVQQHLAYCGVTSADFYGGLDKDFGFKGALKRSPEAVGGFVDFCFEIPQIFLKTDRVCKDCGGRKKRDKGDCLYCSGTGTEMDDNSKVAYAKASSLSIFLAVAEFPPDVETSSPYAQLFTTKTLAIPEAHGAGVYGTLAPVLVKRLYASLPQTQFRDVELAMREAYLHCVCDDPDSTLYNSDFRMRVDEGRLYLHCPGSAAGIHPTDFRDSERAKNGEGYEFTCHNVDSLPQQFALLAGLGRINVESCGHR